MNLPHHAMAHVTRQMVPLPRHGLGWVLGGMLCLGLVQAAQGQALEDPSPAVAQVTALPAPAEEAQQAEEASNVVTADEEGYATWYGPRFHGRRTASGERYNMHAMTAAHPSLPFGTLLRVRSLQNGKEVTVRVNDRGPFTPGYIIDLSKAAAQAIGLFSVGTKEVSVKVLEVQAATTP